MDGELIMADNVISDIRGLLTEIKPLVSKRTEAGSQAATAQANALRRLDAIHSELMRIKQHLGEWTPGSSEIK